MLNYWLSDEQTPEPYRDKGDDLSLPGQLRNMDVQFLRENWQRLMSASRELKVLTYTVPFGMTVDEIIRWYSDPEYAYAAKCLAPWNFVYIDPYGRLLNCMLGNAVGDLKATSVGEAYNSQAFCEFRKNLRERGLYRSCARCCLLNNRLWSFVPNFTSLSS
jgi:MoaA/NifB/PqqE/SkfB family radical SAM enzyme